MLDERINALHGEIEAKKQMLSQIKTQNPQPSPQRKFV